MSTPAARDDDHLGPSAKVALDAVNTGRGSISDLFRVAVNSSGALEAFIGPNGALAKGCLRAKIRESIALDAAPQNGWDLLSVSPLHPRRRRRLRDAKIADAPRGNATDPLTKAILTLASEIVREHGNIASDAIAGAKTAGVSNAECVEVVSRVALTAFTNHLNIVAGAEMDFPVVRAARLVAA